MSELTECNFCRLKRLKAQAKTRHHIIKMIPATWGLGGVEIFIVPRGTTTKQIRSWDRHSSFYDKYHSGWFMDITERCIC